MAFSLGGYYTCAGGRKSNAVVVGLSSSRFGGRASKLLIICSIGQPPDKQPRGEAMEMEEKAADHQP